MFSPHTMNWLNNLELEYKLEYPFLREFNQLERLKIEKCELRNKNYLNKKIKSFLINKLYIKNLN